MQFSKKLSFLMTVSNTTNKQLSQKLHVDPSLISLLRTGRRKLPKNNDRIKDMADFFTKYCTHSSQLEMLYSQIKDVRLKHTPSDETMSDIIYSWLTDTSSLDEFQPLSVSDYPNKSARKKAENDTQMYYDSTGKQKAFADLYKHLCRISPDNTIYICSEETYPVESSASQISQLIEKLLSKGFKICQILFPIENMEIALQSTSNWINIYASGTIDTYYYPRIRDNLYRRTMIIVPGEISLTNTYINNNAQNYQTILSTDINIVSFDYALFCEYKKMCKPAFAIHSSLEDKTQCVDRYILKNQSRLHFSESLPVETLPSQMLYYLKKKCSPEQKRLLSFADKYKDSFSNTLLDCTCIDVCPVATLAQIRAGKIPICFPFIYRADYFYTPETYALHLNSIISTMESNSNYNFYPIPYNSSNQIYGSVFNDENAFFYSKQHPEVMVECLSPAFSRLLSEKAMRVADYYNSTNKEQTITFLKKLVNNLLL